MQKRDTRQDAQAPRLTGPAAATLGRALSRRWSLPPRRNHVAVVRDVAVPMSDGTVLRADHYLPVTDRQVATVLVRSPYGRGFPYNMGSAQLIAERGFHVLLQSCRGTFGSGGEFDPMRHEAADGQDTVAWLRQQHWFDGRLATYGLSYLGFVQWALAQDPPPELVAAVIQVGPHDFSQAAYHHGAFDLQNFLGWSDMVAHQETTGGLAGLWRMATTDRRLRPALNGLPVTASGRDLLGTGAPWFEGWLEHPDVTDPFWAPLQCGAALERIDGAHPAGRRLAGPVPGPDPGAVPGPVRPGRAHPGSWSGPGLTWRWRPGRGGDRGEPRLAGPLPRPHAAAGAMAGAAAGEETGGPPKNSVRVWVGGTAGAGLARGFRLAARGPP